MSVQEKIETAIKRSKSDQRPIAMDPDVTRSAVLEFAQANGYIVDCLLTGGLFDIKGWPTDSTSEQDSWNLLTRS